MLTGIGDRRRRGAARRRPAGAPAARRRSRRSPRPARRRAAAGPRSLEVLEVLARPEADPADRRAVRRPGPPGPARAARSAWARRRSGLASLLVARPPAKPLLPPELAPAPGRIAALLEQRGQGRPGLAGQRPDVEVHARTIAPGGGHRRALHSRGEHDPRRTEPDPAAGHDRDHRRRPARADARDGGPGDGLPDRDRRPGSRLSVGRRRRRGDRRRLRRRGRGGPAGRDAARS